MSGYVEGDDLLHGAQLDGCPVRVEALAVRVAADGTRRVSLEGRFATRGAVAGPAERAAFDHPALAGEAEVRRLAGSPRWKARIAEGDDGVHIDWPTIGRIMQIHRVTAIVMR